MHWKLIKLFDNVFLNGFILQEQLHVRLLFAELVRKQNLSGSD